MKERIETIVCCGSLLIGVIACIFVGWLLIREVRRGRLGRFLATVIYGVTFPVTGAVPIIIALGAKLVGNLVGLALFDRDGGNDGNLVGLGIMGMFVAIVATFLFAAVMLFQALTGSGNSSVNDKG